MNARTISNSLIDGWLFSIHYEDRLEKTEEKVRKFDLVEGKTKVSDV